MPIAIEPPSWLGNIDQFFSHALAHCKTCPKSQVVCFAIQSSTYAKCSNEIGSKILGPCFKGHFEPANMKEVRQKFMWFCPSNVQLRIGGTICFFIVFKPALPNTWTVKKSTNLTNAKIFSLVDARFELHIFDHALFHVPKNATMSVGIPQRTKAIELGVPNQLKGTT